MAARIIHTRASLEHTLRAHGIEFTTHEHPPVFTVAEADAATGSLPGTPTKNLFLRDEKGRRYVLATLPATKRLSLKVLGELLGLKKPSFASPERLLEYLGVTPGSVTVFGLINDPEKRVECVLDRRVWDSPELQCHPLVNTATAIVPKASLARFFELTGHAPLIIDIPEEV